MAPNPIKSWGFDVHLFHRHRYGITFKAPTRPARGIVNRLLRPLGGERRLRSLGLVLQRRLHQRSGLETWGRVATFFAVLLLVECLDSFAWIP